MAREKADYRPILEDIKDFLEEQYGVRYRDLNITDVMKFTGKSRNTVVKLFDFRGTNIQPASLAAQLSSWRRHDGL